FSRGYPSLSGRVAPLREWALHGRSCSRLWRCATRFVTPEGVRRKRHDSNQQQVLVSPRSGSRGARSRNARLEADAERGINENLHLSCCPIPAKRRIGVLPHLWNA